MAWLPPDKEAFKQVRKPKINLLKSYRESTGDDWGIHTTDTVDINIILNGEIWMELDDGAEVKLQQGIYITTGKPVKYCPSGF